jgi:succinylglutamate desuccinylase
MTDVAVRERLGPVERVIGEWSSTEPGPLFIAVGGVHGNECSGVFAARRVLAVLREQRTRLRGRFVALAGNLRALEGQVRYLDHDLNRIWTEGEVEGVRAFEPDELSGERREQRELLDVIERELARNAGSRPATFLDLHTTSADGPPFSIIGDTLQNRRIAFALGVPVILGLEETVEGTMLGWLAERGHIAIGIEGGQHELASTIDNHESAIWIALVASGLLDAADVPAVERHRVRLVLAANGIPAVVEIRHRHGLLPDEHFEMEQGLANFDPVAEGQLLAHSSSATGDEEVRSPEGGVLLLPRYQGQGDDGFFLGRAVHGGWLRLSVWVRRLRLDRLLALLPGISRPTGRRGDLIVNRRVARWFSTEIFHLMGYRRRRSEGGWLIFTKRLEGPPTAT